MAELGEILAPVRYDRMRVVVYECTFRTSNRDDRVVYVAEANEHQVETLITRDALACLKWFPVTRPIADRPFWERRLCVEGKGDVSRFRRLLREDGADLDRRNVLQSTVEAWVRKYETSRRGRKPEVGRLP